LICCKGKPLVTVTRYFHCYFVNENQKETVAHPYREDFYARDSGLGSFFLIVAMPPTTLLGWGFSPCPDYSAILEIECR